MVRAVILPFVKIEELSDEEREKSNVLPLNNITFTVLYCFHYVVSYSLAFIPNNNLGDWKQSSLK